MLYLRVGPCAPPSLPHAAAMGTHSRTHMGLGLTATPSSIRDSASLETLTSSASSSMPSGLLFASMKPLSSFITSGVHACKHPCFSHSTHAAHTAHST
jgi:hypothetical protein